MELLPPATAESAARRRALMACWLDAEDVSRLLAIPISQIPELRRQRKLLGVWVQDVNAYLFPDFQFQGGRAAACLPQLLALLPSPSGSGWEWVEWFVSPHAYLHADRPMDLLATGRCENVLAAAREEYGASPSQRW